MKALQGGVGDFPPFLRPMHERPVDVAFYGCVLWAKLPFTPGTARDDMQSHKKDFKDSPVRLFAANTKVQQGRNHGVRCCSTWPLSDSKIPCFARTSCRQRELNRWRRAVR